MVSGELSGPAGIAPGTARLNADGSPDPSFQPVETAALALAIDSGGRIILVGDFSSLRGVPRPGVARLNPDGTLDPDFHPDFRPVIGAEVRSVSRILIQREGKIALVLNYTTNARPAVAVVRLLPTGFIDPEFQPLIDPLFTRINALAQQADGKLLMAGKATFEPNRIGRALIRLRTDGMPDTFDPGLNLSQVFALALQPDGKILVGREQFPGGAAPLVRLNPNGSIDGSFVIPGLLSLPHGPITSIAIESDGAIVAAGWFGAVDDILRENLARFRPDGSLDGAFAGLRVDQHSEPEAMQMVFQPDGKLLIGGNLRIEEGGEIRDGLARFQPIPPEPVALFRVEGRPNVAEDAGSLDLVIRRESSTEGAAVVTLTTVDGSATSGTDFQGQTNEVFFLSGEERRTVSIPIYHDGLYEGTEVFFVHLTGQGPRTGVVTPITRVEIYDTDVGVEFTESTLLTGEFAGQVYVGLHLSGARNSPTTLQLGVSGGSPTPGLDFVIANPTVEFQPGQSFQSVPITIIDDSEFEGTESLELLLSQPSSGVVLAGRSNAVLRIQDNDDPRGVGFGANAVIYAATRLPEGQIILAGDFSSIHGARRQRVARLNPDLSLDPGFDPGPGPDGVVTALAIQPDEKVLIGGYFTHVSGSGRNGIARLNRDGSLDLQFNPGTGLTRASGLTRPASLAVAQDGTVLVGGDFSAIDGVPRSGLARLHATGAVDLEFNPVLQTQSGGLPAVGSIALRANGDLLVAGSFDSVDGRARPGFAGLTSDGKLSPESDSMVAAVLERGPVRGTLYVTTEIDGQILVSGQFAGGPRILAFQENRPDPVLDAVVNFPIDAPTRLATDLSGNIIFSDAAGLRLRRLNRDGNLDPDFGLGVEANLRVYALMRSANGAVIVAGALTALNEIPYNRLAELDSQGRFLLPVRLNLISSLADGRGSLMAQGGENFPFVVETSTNLFGWLPLYTNLPPGSPNILSMVEKPAQFFRIRRL